MTQQEFTGLFLGYLVKKIPFWLPEESTETEMLDIMQKRISEHNIDIKEILTSDRRINGERRVNGERRKNGG